MINIAKGMRGNQLLFPSNSEIAISYRKSNLLIIVRYVDRNSYLLMHHCTLCNISYRKSNLLIIMDVLSLLLILLLL